MANASNYTIPSDNRELQLKGDEIQPVDNYTIPSDNRELQPVLIWTRTANYYTIPSDNRELQHLKDRDFAFKFFIYAFL